MASHALKLPLEVHIFAFPPLEISTWLLYDGLGISIPSDCLALFGLLIVQIIIIIIISCFFFFEYIK